MPGRDNPPNLRDYSLIAYVIERFFRFLQFLPPWVILSNRADYQNTYDPTNLAQARLKSKIRATKIDIYIFVWLILESVLIYLVSKGTPYNKVTFWSINILAVVRITDVLQVTINMSIFDSLRIKTQGNQMASVVRTIVLTAINYFELLICFGLIYATQLELLGKANDWTDAFYFSVISQLTIGYGDIAPLRWGKIVSVSQGLIGYLFSLIILARFVSLLPKPVTVLGDDK